MENRNEKTESLHCHIAHAGQKLPDNKQYALKRASLLHASLLKDPKKRDHFVSFMEQILKMVHAEVAPPLSESQDCWYLPLFEVYNPKQTGPNQGRI